MCYSVPAIAAFFTTFLYLKKRTSQIWQLNLLFYGGALFGIIDHAWNRELFYISENIVSDVALGIVITAGLFIFWKVSFRWMSKSELNNKNN